MSGHSKWSTIKRHKQAEDIKRGRIFTKIARAITVAVRQGHGVTDPEKNFRLRLAIDKAREANMPKSNIEKALRRAQGKQPAGGGLEEVVYEGYGPFGVAVIVEAATDNKKRTSQELKSIFERGGGSLGATGSVSFLFEKKGLVVVKKDDLGFDQILEKALEAGADDLEETEDEFEIYTEDKKLHLVKKILEEKGLRVFDSDLTYRPKSTVVIDQKEKAEKILKFMDSLEDFDDVQKVYANFDIPKEIVKTIKM